MHYPQKILFAPHGRLLKYLALAIVVLVLAGILVRFLPALKGSILHKILDLDTEGNIPTIFSACLILGASIIAHSIAISEERANRGARGFWLISAAILLVMGFDELFGFHNMTAEFVPKYVKEISFLKYRWVVAGIVIAFLTGLILLPFLRYLPGRVRNRLMLAALVYLGGALVMEMIGAHVKVRIEPSTKLLYWTCIVIEETMEMLGVLLAISAMFDYIKCRNRKEFGQ